MKKRKLADNLSRRFLNLEVVYNFLIPIKEGEKI